MSEKEFPIESDRRLVTVMFADISGFTAMSEKMDPEDIADVMKDCFSMMGKCIEEHGGTIDKFIGDCVMVLYGAPKAQEDAPHRALNTALEIKKRLHAFNEEKHLVTPLDIHIGINTGPVIAGMMGSDKRQDFTVMGDTVNLASRMESVAETGTILVSENTHRLTEGYFDFEPIGEVKVKGKEQPVKAYKVLGPRRIITRLEACQGKGLSPFVGRNRELEHLKACLEQACTGHGQAVGIMGEPGVGKSRLIRQFRESLPEVEYTIIEGGCIHFGDAIPYLPILDMIRDYFDINEDEDESAIKEKIRDKVTSLSKQLEHILSPLHEVLSLKVEDQEYVKLDAKQRRDKVFESIRLLLIAESQKNPLVVIIEDLHWMDKTSEDFLSFLINSLATSRILLLLLFRPEYIPSWAGKTYYSQIRVDQLPRTTIEDLVVGILKSKEIEPALIEFIANRTEGNPLFIEELTFNLLENGAIRNDINRYTFSLKPADIQVPATIQGIIAARLDRLEGKLKEVMQTASVIGREFAFRILQSVASLKEDLKLSVLTLQDLEFIYEKNLFPELEYIFKHALTRDVAYNSLLIKKRKETHERVAQAIEQIYADRLEEFYEMIAYHYSLSENNHKAHQYLKLSGDKAVKNYSNIEAVRFYKDALRILDKKTEGDDAKKKIIEIGLLTQTPLYFLGYPEGSLDIIHKIEGLAEEIRDSRSLITIYSKIGWYHTVKGNPLKALEYSEKAFYEAGKVNDLELMARLAREISFALWLTGDNVKLLDITHRAISPIEESHREKDLYAEGVNLYSSLCGYYGLASGWLGEFLDGKKALEKGLQIAHEVKDKYQMGVIEAWFSTVLYWEGDGENVIEHMKRGIKHIEEARMDVLMGNALIALGYGYCLIGNHHTANEYLEESIKVQKASSMLPWNYWHLAMNQLASGDQVKAKEYFKEALKLSLELNTIVVEGVAKILIGCVGGKIDPLCTDDVLQQIKQGFQILEELKLKPCIAMGYLHWGELLTYWGRRDEALENLKKAEGLYYEMKVTPKSYWLKRTHEALAKLG